MTPTATVVRYVTEVLGGTDSGSVDELVSNEELRQRSRSLRRAFPDLEIETTVLVAEGDLVAGTFVARGTHEGIFDGVPPTGRTWEARFAAVYRVDSGGRIADAWVTWDQRSLLEPLGAVERVDTGSA